MKQYFERLAFEEQIMPFEILALIWCGICEKEIYRKLSECVDLGLADSEEEAIWGVVNEYLYHVFNLEDAFNQNIGRSATPTELFPAYTKAFETVESSAGPLQVYSNGYSQCFMRQDFRDWVLISFPETYDGPFFLTDESPSGPLKGKADADGPHDIETLLSENKVLKAKLEMAKAFEQKPETEDKTVSTSNEDLRLIGALKDVALGELSAFDVSTQSKLIDAIISHFGDYRGLGKRSMEDKFAAANRLFKVS